MLATALAALVLQPAGVSAAAEFFPLNPGARWTYEATGGVPGTFVDSVGEAVEVGGLPAIPVVSSMGGRNVGTTYYRVDNDTVLLVAYNPKMPLDPAQPVFKVGPGTQKWTHVGTTMMAGGATLQRVTGEARMVRRRKVLDREVDVLEVRLRARVGDDEMAVDVDQTARYGRGIGLFEMNQTSRIGRRTERSSLRLIAFQPGGDADK